MKLKTYQFEGMISKISSSYKGALFFGPDEGQVEDLADKMRAFIVPDKKDAFLYAAFDGTKMKDRVSDFNAEAAAISLLGGRRLIEVRDASEDITEGVSYFLDHQETDTFVLLKAGNLKKNSVLRALCEDHPKMACFACYLPEEKEIGPFVEDFLRQKGVRIDFETKAYLEKHIGLNRSIIKAELEKLLIYIGDKKTVSLADAEASIGDVSSSSIESLINGIMQGDHFLVQTKFDILQKEGESEVSLLRIISGYFQKLLLTSSRIHSGMDRQTAYKKLYPPLNFKTKPVFERNLSVWGEKALTRALALLSDAEVQCKNSAFEMGTVVSHALLLLTQAGKNLSKRR